MSDEEKLDLLSRTIWKKKEAREYSKLSVYLLNKIFKECQHPTFKNSIFRDKFLHLIGTNVRKEIIIINGKNKC